MIPTFEIDGSRITDIASFYDEVNRVFMADEDWVLAPSLDALDDMLYGAYGAARGAGPVRVVWAASDDSRRALGVEATREWYRSKLAHPEVFDAERAQSNLAAFESAGGPTYFELVLEVFAGHDRVELILG